jgi:hypothetical protein
MEIIDIVLVSVFLVTLIFPFFYMYYKNVKNRMLFISSVIGASFIVAMLMLVISTPIAIFIVKIVPQLAEDGMANNLIPFVEMVDVIEEYYYFLISSLLSIALPILFYKRYDIFHLTNKGTGRKKPAPVL